VNCSEKALKPYVHTPELGSTALETLCCQGDPRLARSLQPGSPVTELNVHGKTILPDGFEPQQCGAGRFLNAEFLRAARKHPMAPALDESAALFMKAGRGWNKVSEIFEKTTPLKTKEEVKTLLTEAAETISGISDIEERAFRLLNEI
jgi:hypothetical protein